MTPSPYTEDALVQQTTADYLEQQLGWESLYAHNREDFGPESLLGRRDDREVVLTRTLRAKLKELNPGLPDMAYDDALRQIVTSTATQTLLATNREKYTLFRDGVLVTFQNEKGERLKHRLRVFDFDFFDDSSGETKKIVARNHQFLGVNRALEPVVERRERKRGSLASSGIPSGRGRAI